MRAALIAAAALALAGCDDGRDERLNSTTPLLSEGGFAVATSIDAPGSGDAFFSASQNGYVVLSSPTEATVLYVTGPNGARRVPAATAGVTVAFQRQDTLDAQTLTAAALVGSYDAWLGGKPVTFTVDANGRLSGSGACTLSGALEVVNRYGPAIGAQLTLGSGCPLPAGDYRGVAYLSGEQQPGRFRLVAENGSAVADLIAYR